jgi:PhzF family phenazine biosynthesis protein
MIALLYQVDAFTSEIFHGNPAAVVLLDEYPEEATLRAIAAENNLSETAYLVAQGEDYRLRWFTPLDEIALCGHATLASAAVVLERIAPSRDAVRFHTASGILTVRKLDQGYAMDFPAYTPELASKPAGLAEALGAEPLQVWESSFLLVELRDAATVRALSPQMERLKAMHAHGVIVTAAGDAGYDCVSRVFVPAHGVPEDPVTGSAHCVLAPYWSARLGKKEIRAYQSSQRGGELLCTYNGERVQLQGQCVFSLEGKIVLG